MVSVNGHRRHLAHLVLAGLVCFFVTLKAQGESDEALRRWFESDEPLYQERGGGEALVFISASEERTPFSMTWMTITEQSLDTGWVAIEQCHEGLDPVPDAEVVYRFENMRNLGITESHSIGRAWVEGQSIQLHNVGKAARLCVALEALVLKPIGKGRYRLRYGPFQRRFLDSYFSMHIAMEIRLPESLMHLLQVSPPQTEGFAVNETDGVVSVDAWFRGKLVIELLFSGEADLHK